MIALLLAAAAAGGSAVDAERAFARDAQHIGQWTAFRKWADHDAVMFVPQAAWARVYLTGRKDPKHPLRWLPAQSLTSCDGQVAINSGPWISRDPVGRGRFTTIWLNKAGGWHWTYDGSGPMSARAAVRPVVRVLRASCRGQPTGAPIMPPPPPAPKASSGDVPDDTGRGQAGDKTLGWDWTVDKAGTRTLRVFQWTGRSYRQVVDQHIAGASQPEGRPGK